MNYRKSIKVILFLLFCITLSQASVLTVLSGTKGQADSELKGLEKRFDDIGFSIAAKNEHLETHYYNKFKDKNLDLLNFYRIYDKNSMRELLLKNPNFGAFTPFNFLAFKELDSAERGDITWYGYLDSETMLNIIGETDESDRKKFKDMLSKIDKLVEDEMKPEFVQKLEYSGSLPTRALLKMVKKFENVDDIDSFAEDFIMEYDSIFTKNNFVIAGFLDLKFEYDDLDMDFEKYDAYWVSSLCHFKFSNAIFNHGEPQAGVFAPCSIYFYIPKDSNELHVGYATVENWTTTTGIKDKTQLAYMKEVADEVYEIFKKLGFVLEGEIDESLEKPQTVSHDLTAEISELKVMIESLTREVKDLKKIVSEPTESIEGRDPAVSKKEFKTPKMTIGGDRPEKLAAYYVAQPQTVDSLVKSLKESGFEVLSVTDILDKKTVVTVTNDQLRDSNTFLAALNILVNGSSEIRVQNPSYFAAAYLRDNYKYGEFKDLLRALESALGDMYETEEVVELDRLRDYNFMPNMSKFDDFVELDDGDDLIENIRGENSEKYIAYRLELPNGSILVGHKMRTKTNKFLIKVGEERNAQLLPYQSIIKDDVVYMLDPTFYLALSLPLLSMEDFMKIASTPDEIGKSLRRAYR
ncbi:MAG: hypothetical protein U9R27_05390 [Campylobacterota bacterium]|nr:hypothetical protein [Campylobacterota bacterium]